MTGDATVRHSVRSAALSRVRSALPGLVAGLVTVSVLTIATAPTQPAEAQAHHPHGPDLDRAARAHRSGLPWSSGVTPFDVSGTEAERFGLERGAPVDNVVVYPGRESWDTLLSTFWRQALPSYFDPVVDDLVVTLPLWPASNSVRNPGTPEQWAALGSNIAESDPDAYVRLGWEMNIGVSWGLTPGNRSRWVRAFRHATKDLRTGCPSCRIVWNPNHGLGNSGLDSRKVFLQVKRLVDVYAIDDYDIYPPIKNAATRREHLDGYGQFTESYRFARRWGKKFAVPEWGIACNDPGCYWRGNAGGDNPQYIAAVMAWFDGHRRGLAFESYFDEPARTTRSALYTRPIGPRAGRAYRAAIRAYRR